VAHRRKLLGKNDAVRVVDNPDESRYEIYDDDKLAGFSSYRLVGDRIVFLHTEVDPAFEGRGVGGALVRAELEDARRRGLPVIVRCPFIARFIREHPEYAPTA
jgi:predicted GNAT family acetyltransferase